MKTNWLTKVALLAMLLLGGRAMGQKIITVTAKEAVDTAFKNVIDLKNARLDYDYQDAKNKELVSAALPQINGTAGMSHYLSRPTIDFPNANYFLYDDLIKQGLPITTPGFAKEQSNAFSFVYPWNMNYGAQLNQLLFQPDVFIALKAKRETLKLAEAGIKVKEDEVKLSVYKTYYGVLIAQKQLVYLNESITRLEKLQHDQNEIFKNGFAEKLDIDKTTVSLNNLKSTSYQLQNGIAISYIMLKNAIGVNQQDSLVLKDTLTEDMVQKEILAAADFNYDDRNEIKLLKKTSDLMKLDVWRNKLSKYPTVSFYGNFNSQAQRDQFDFFKDKKWINTTLIGLNLTVPIYNGSIRKHKLREAQITLEKNNNTIENVKRVIDMEQGIAKNSYTNAALTLEAQKRNMELARRVYETTKKKYEQGLGSSFEILQSDTELQSAQGNYFKALYDAVIARFNFLKAVGKL